MSKRNEGFCNNLKRADLYGEPVSVNFRKKNFYQTRLGAFVTIFTAIIIISYFVIQMEKWVTKRNPDVVTNTILRDMKDIEPISAYE